MLWSGQTLLSASIVRAAGESSHGNRAHRSLQQFPPSELAEAGLGARLQQAELGFTQVHLAANLFLALLVKIESRHYLPVPLPNPIQNTHHELHPLLQI